MVAVVEAAGPVQPVDHKAFELRDPIEVPAYVTHENRPVRIVRARIDHFRSRPRADSLTFGIPDECVSKLLLDDAICPCCSAFFAPCSAVFCYIQVGIDPDPTIIHLPNKGF